MGTGAIILAAGISSRMKQFKPMMCVGQKPMIKCVVDMLTKSRISPIVVVTGYRAEQINHCLAGKNVTLVHNRRFAQTDMFESLKLGIGALEGKCERALIMPADMPLISTETVKKIISVEGLAVKPVYNGEPGHPIILSSELFGELKAYGGDRGLRGMLERLGVSESYVPVGDEGVLLDVNTYEEYLEILAADAKRSGKGTLHLDCNFSLAVNDTVMDNDVMLLLEMLSYTGSIQTASECMNSSYSKSWRQIKNIESQMGIQIVQSSAGGTNGGGTRLTEDGRQLLEAYNKLQAEGDKMMNFLFREHFADFLVQN